MRVDLLAFGAHPDDVEIGMGGILIKHSKAGYTTAICDLTEAELSSNGTVETRKKEAQKAGQILGLTDRINLRFPDRGLSKSIEQMDQMTQVIRKFQPTIVFAPYFEDRHPDHVLCGHMVRDAVFNAALQRKKIDSEPAHRVQQLYFYFINGMGKADLVVDISDVYREKMQALKAYRSQFTRENKEVETPINDPHFFDRIQGKDLNFGHQVGVVYGEGLVSSTPIVVPTLL